MSQATNAEWFWLKLSVGDRQSTDSVEAEEKRSSALCFHSSPLWSGPI